MFGKRALTCLILIMALARSSNCSQFNTSAIDLCSTECFFMNPAIWDDGVVPSAGSFVNITVSGTVAATISVTTATSIGDLLLSGPVIFKLSNSEFNSTTLLIVEGANLFLTANSRINGANATISSGEINISNSSFVTQYLNLDVSSKLEGTGGGETTIVDLGRATISGNITFSPETYLYCLTCTFSTNDVVLPNKPFLNSVNFTYVSGTFENGLDSAFLFLTRSTLTVSVLPDFLYVVFRDTDSTINIFNSGQDSVIGHEECQGCIIGAGTFRITDSNITLANGDFASRILAATFTFIGVNNVIALETSFGPITFAAHGSSPTYVTFNFSNVALTQDVYIFGEIHSSGNLNINATVSLSGGMTLTSGVVLVYATLYVSSSLVIKGSAAMVLNATLVSPRIQIFDAGALSASNPNQFVIGNFLNGGLLSVSSAHSIGLTGTYTQTESGVFQVNNIDPNENDYTPLSINGTASLNGTLQYTITKPVDHPVDIVVLFASEGITGNFQVHKDSSNLQTVVDILVSHNSVTIRIVSAANEKQLLPLWAWVVIVAGGGTAFLVLLVVVIVNCKSRKKKYTQIK